MDDADGTKCPPNLPFCGDVKELWIEHHGLPLYSDVDSASRRWKSFTGSFKNVKKLVVLDISLKQLFKARFPTFPSLLYLNVFQSAQGNRILGSDTSALSKFLLERSREECKIAKLRLICGRGCHIQTHDFSAAGEVEMISIGKDERPVFPRDNHKRKVGSSCRGHRILVEHTIHEKAARGCGANQNI